MRRFFDPNIDRTGRIVRGAMSAALLIGGLVAMPHSWLLALILFASGAFVLVEALRGWCALRACGIRTKL
jgi:hypothetical protein